MAGPAADLRRRLDLPADRPVVLYLPTARRRDRAPADPLLDLEAWAEALGDRAYLLLRPPPGEAFVVPTRLRFAMRDLGDVDALAPFVAASELVISDYSSLIGDAALIDRPLVLFQPDRETYVNRTRGVYPGLDEVGPACVTTDELDHRGERLAGRPGGLGRSVRSRASGMGGRPVRPRRWRRHATGPWTRSWEAGHDRPRIVLMANNIDEVGGAQRVVHVVAQQLGLRGYPVDLVGVAPHPPRHEYVDDPAFRRFTLMPEEWPPPPKDSRLGTRLTPSVRRVIAKRAALRATAIARLGEVLADGPPGIVVTSQLWAMEHLAEVPHDEWAVIGQYHSSFEAAEAGRDLPRALALYDDVDLVTLLTPEDADRFRRAGLNNTDWLPNPLAFWPQEPAAPDGDADVVTYLGRLSTEKGPTLPRGRVGQGRRSPSDVATEVRGLGPR